MQQALGEVSWERIIRAVEKVRDRLRRTGAVLDGAGIPYAAAGGNAVYAWVSRIDELAARSTQDVDIVLRRSDLPAAVRAMEAAGFVYRHVAGIDMFLDGPNARARDAVHVVFAGEKVRQHYDFPAPDIDQPLVSEDVSYLNLESLVRMKLTSFRDKDRTHLRDLIGVGLVDASWSAKLPPELASRLQQLIDTPEG
jgi:hypothetical protein